MTSAVSPRFGRRALENNVREWVTGRAVCFSSIGIFSGRDFSSSFCEKVGEWRIMECCYVV